MSEEPENFTLAPPRKRGATLDSLGEGVSHLRREMATHGDLADVRSEVSALRADIASDMLGMEKRLGDQLAGLRRSVMEYHASAIGHGVQITELEERVRRLEREAGFLPEEY